MAAAPAEIPRGSGLTLVSFGVRPPLDLAGFAIGRRVVADAAMRTSGPNICAAGNIARYPSPVGGRPTGVKHWVLAERSGQVAAPAMLRFPEALREPPFSGTSTYDPTPRYVGDVDVWDRVEQTRSSSGQDAEIRYTQEEVTVAAATLHRDLAPQAAQQMAAAKSHLTFPHQVREGTP